jgi:hypothetical protein
MGCFSYLCQICNKPINSDAINGEGVKLWLLQKGEILEEKEGDYDSYGSVFEKHEWENSWNKIIDLHFNSDCSDGIAAIHTDCWYKSKKIIPTTQSEDDENQGWGKLKKKSAPVITSTFYKYIDETPTKKDIELDEQLKELGEKVNKVMQEAEKLLNKLKTK